MKWLGCMPESNKDLSISGIKLALLMEPPSSGTGTKGKGPGPAFVRSLGLEMKFPPRALHVQFLLVFNANGSGV